MLDSISLTCGVQVIYYDLIVKVFTKEEKSQPSDCRSELQRARNKTIISEPVLV